MPWHARLQLDYGVEHGRCVARFLHEGPLRILQSLYPEGDAICHNILVHPPGGLVGGDTVDVRVSAAQGSHGLVTTPGASRFYRSEGETAAQRVHLRLEAGARMEWLPLETLYFSGALAHNALAMDLAPGSELIGWDVAALGLPQSAQPFVEGEVVQELTLRGAWLERGRIAADDMRLLDGPLGLAGQRCMATLFWCAGTEIGRERREKALDLARAEIEANALAPTAGATAPHPQVVVVRVLAPMVEPVMGLLKRIRGAWRQALWQGTAEQPRGWAL